MINPKSLYRGLQPSFCFILVESATSSGGSPGLLGAHSTGKSTPVTFFVYPISPYTAEDVCQVLQGALPQRIEKFFPGIEMAEAFHQPGKAIGGHQKPAASSHGNDDRLCMLHSLRISVEDPATFGRIHLAPMFLQKRHYGFSGILRSHAACPAKKTNHLHCIYQVD